MACDVSAEIVAQMEHSAPDISKHPAKFMRIPPLSTSISCALKKQSPETDISKQPLKAHAAKNFPNTIELIEIGWLKSNSNVF